MFTDHVEINVSGGNGGNGCVSWRREKYIAKGGPDGGNGGKGGDVILVVDENTDTLSHFSSRKRFTAKNGKKGAGKQQFGKYGEDLILKVPPGTTVSIDSNQVADLYKKEDSVVIAKGGRGGFGNAHFKSSVRQRPDFSEKGEPGESKNVSLELKLVADVGIIGFPSVGKSTLISVVSSAKPKIAAYEFTTIVPNLGVVNIDDRSFIICDVPGLIEGASEGKGLGHDFLKHIERCGILVHMLDLSRALVDGSIDVEKLAEDYEILRGELKEHSLALSEKKEVVVVNKSDLVQSHENLIKDLRAKGIEVFSVISSATTTGTEELMKYLLPIVIEERQRRFTDTATTEQIKTLTPHIKDDDMGAYKIISDMSSVRIEGSRIEQFTNMTDFNSQGGIMRFRDVINRIGLKKAIRKASEGESKQIFIGDTEVTEYLDF